MSNKNINTIMLGIIILLLIALGLYIFFNSNQEINNSNLASNDTDLVGQEDSSDLNSSEKQSLLITYLEENISELSPEDAVLGGTFYVTNIEFPEEGIAVVSYEDGHIALEAKADYIITSNNEVEINSFTIIPDGSTTDREGNGTSICEDRCGDGVCQEIVCMGSGCPCAENAQNCSADCS